MIVTNRRNYGEYGCSWNNWNGSLFVGDEAIVFIGTFFLFEKKMYLPWNHIVHIRNGKNSLGGGGNDTVEIVVEVTTTTTTTSNSSNSNSGSSSSSSNVVYEFCSTETYPTNREKLWMKLMKIQQDNVLRYNSNLDLSNVNGGSSSTTTTATSKSNSTSNDNNSNNSKEERFEMVVDEDNNNESSPSNSAVRFIRRRSSFPGRKSIGMSSSSLRLSLGDHNDSSCNINSITNNTSATSTTTTITAANINTKNNNNTKKINNNIVMMNLSQGLLVLDFDDDDVHNDDFPRNESIQESNVTQNPANDFQPSSPLLTNGSDLINHGNNSLCISNTNRSEIHTGIAPTSSTSPSSSVPLVTTTIPPPSSPPPKVTSVAQSMEIAEIEKITGKLVLQPIQCLNNYNDISGRLYTGKHALFFTGKRFFWESPSTVTIPWNSVRHIKTVATLQPATTAETLTTTTGMTNSTKEVIGISISVLLAKHDINGITNQHTYRFINMSNANHVVASLIALKNDQEILARTILQHQQQQQQQQPSQSTKTTNIRGLQRRNSDPLLQTLQFGVHTASTATSNVNKYTMEDNHDQLSTTGGTADPTKPSSITQTPLAQQQSESNSLKDDACRNTNTAVDDGNSNSNNSVIAETSLPLQTTNTTTTVPDLDTVPTTSTTDLSVYADHPEQFTRATQATAESEKIYTNVVVPNVLLAIPNTSGSSSVDIFFDLFLSDHAKYGLYHQFLEIRGESNILVEEWKPAVKESTALPSQKRIVKYIHPVNAPLAPPKASARKHQTYEHYGSNTGIVVTTETYVDDVPKADCFYVVDRVIVASTSPLEAADTVHKNNNGQGCIRLTLEFGITFIKSTMFRGIIVSRTTAEVTDLMKAMLTYIQDALATEEKQTKEQIQPTDKTKHDDTTKCTQKITLPDSSDESSSVSAAAAAATSTATADLGDNRIPSSTALKTIPPPTPTVSPTEHISDDNNKNKNQDTVADIASVKNDECLANINLNKSIIHETNKFPNFDSQTFGNDITINTFIHMINDILRNGIRNDIRNIPVLPILVLMVIFLLLLILMVQICLVSQTRQTNQLLQELIKYHSSQTKL